MPASGCSSQLQRRLDWRDQTLGLLAPEDSHARKVLALSGVEDVLLMDTTLEAATDRLHLAAEPS